MRSGARADQGAHGCVKLAERTVRMCVCVYEYVLVAVWFYFVYET